LALILSSLICFELILAYGIRLASNFTLRYVNIQFSQYHFLKTCLFSTEWSCQVCQKLFGFICEDTLQGCTGLSLCQ
jgi:hypothetical protein